MTSEELAKKIELIQESTLSDCDSITCDFDTNMLHFKEEIYTFVERNQEDIKKIYQKIKDGKNPKVVSVKDMNLAIHSYSQYLTDMQKYFNAVSHDDKVSMTLDEAFVKMQAKDKSFFDSAVSEETETISDAMKNVEAIIDLKQLGHDAKDMFKDINNSDMNYDLKCKVLSFLSKSVCTFITQVISGINVTVSEILTKLDSGISLEGANTKFLMW